MGRQLRYALVNLNAGIAIFSAHDYFDVAEFFLLAEGIGRNRLSEIHGPVRLGGPASNSRIIKIRSLEPQENFWNHRGADLRVPKRGPREKRKDRWPTETLESVSPFPNGKRYLPQNNVPGLRASQGSLDGSSTAKTCL